MDGAIHSSAQWEVLRACRLIRTRWSWEERHQRRRVAAAKQRELWRLLGAARTGLAAWQSITLLSDLSTESTSSRSPNRKRPLRRRSRSRHDL